MARILSLVVVASCLAAPLSVVSATMISVPTTEFEARIRQNYEQITNDAANEMTKKYHNVEYILKAYATYLHQEDINFPCFADFIKRTMNELFRQKQILIEFVKKRGGASRYVSPNIEETCKAIITDANADLGDSTDTTTRMCICKELSGSVSAWTGQSCPAASAAKRTGKNVLEDLVAALRYINHHNQQLINTAGGQNDVNFDQLVRYYHMPRVTHQINHAAQEMYKLRKVLDEEPSNYELYEEWLDKNVMCKKHLS